VERGHLILREDSNWQLTQAARRKETRNEGDLDLDPRHVKQVKLEGFRRLLVPLVCCRGRQQVMTVDHALPWIESTSPSPAELLHTSKSRCRYSAVGTAMRGKDESRQVTGFVLPIHGSISMTGKGKIFR